MGKVHATAPGSMVTRLLESFLFDRGDIVVVDLPVDCVLIMCYAALDDVVT